MIQGDYGAYSFYSNRFNSRNQTTVGYSNPTGVNGGRDCPSAGVHTAYGYRGWYYDLSNAGSAKVAIRARQSDWAPGKGIVIDYEYNDGNSGGWMDTHGNGLNMLKIDGSAKLTGNNITGLPPTIYYATAYNGYSLATAYANGSSSLMPYAVGNAAGWRLWRYYETGQIN